MNIHEPREQARIIAGRTTVIREHEFEAEAALRHLTQEYVRAQHAYLEILREVDELREAGNHKKKNLIINQQLRKAATFRNICWNALQAFLDRQAALL